MQQKNWGKMIVVFVIAFLLGGAFFVYLNENSSLAENSSRNSESTAKIDNKTAVLLPSIGATMSVADITEKSSPAIVNIQSQIKVNSVPNNPFFNDPFFREFFGDQFEVRPDQRYDTGIGTGFIISSDGYIVTNQHVINQADKVTVQLNGENDEIPAKVVGQDYDLDLAVLKIEGSGYPTLPLGNSDVMRAGEMVIAIGQPFGLDHTVTVGVISAKGRPISIEDRDYRNLIQTDAAINPGNSGGPLLNSKGQVIGINTAVNAQAQGIGFAIPINTARDVLDELRSGKKIVKPFLGIQMTAVNQTVRDELNLPDKTRGVIVVEVLDGTAAARAGIKQFDIVQAIEGEAVQTAIEVQNAIASKKAGEKITLMLLRDGKQITIPVVLQAKP
ncbi:MAG: trypsin-like peptidase domain-containing protein [Syntrophomonadaceae bacterium]|nr:trypsin-like peptidase domain-containing protein [Syntrophomonadaceae bacterium]